MLGAGLLSALLAMLTPIAVPIVIRHIIDGPVRHHHFTAVIPAALLVLLLGLIDGVGAWGRRRLVAPPATKFEIGLRAAIYRKLQALSVGVHDSWDSGQLISRAVDDLSTLRRFVGFSALFLVINAVVLLLGLVVMFLMDWRLGLAQLIISIPLVAVFAHFEKRHSKASRLSQDQAGDLATTAEESAQGIRVLKAFGRGPYLTERFAAQSRALQQTELRKVWLTATLWSVVQGLPRIAVAFTIGYGGYAVAEHRMTIGTLVAAFTLANFLQWPPVWMGFQIADLDAARTAADRFFEIMDAPTHIVDPDDPVELPVRLSGELRFEHVRFRFPDADHDVLSDVSLVLRPGETVALVGATGSGKTALLNLIPRLYNVDAGRISLDGVDIADLRVADLRSVVSVAFEDSVLFSASVRENVALGDPAATDDDVALALEVAHATEFVAKLPWGLDTRIGEQGLSLSGGQRQRLALARAVLRGSRFVVLDDPLSALDVETEEKVQARLREVLSASTTLLVAHRPSTAALADRVAVLAEGRIVAEGTHEHLLEVSGRYRELMGGSTGDPASSGYPGGPGVPHTTGGK
jgi:ATP-binding cassette subfamily B protein